MVGVALVSGCSTSGVNNVSYSVPREENVLNKILPEFTEAPTTAPWVKAKLDSWSLLSEERNQSPATDSSENKASLPSPEVIVVEPEETSAQDRDPAEAAPVAEPPINIESTTFVDNVETCKVPEYTFTGPHAKGFPIKNNAVPYLGNVNIAVIAIDFSDAPGDIHKPLSEYRKQLNKTIEWSKFYSGNKMVYNIQMEEQWLRAPKPATSYPKRNDGDRYAEMQDWIEVADDHYDFSKINFVYFIVPEKAHFVLGADMYGNGRATSDEGYFEARTFTYYAPPELTWSHLIHEVLHDQGFIGHGPKNGSGYGIMMGQWYNSMSVLSWPSFMAGWLDDDDIVCIDARDGFDDVVIDIQSLDRLGASPGIKSVIIRTGNTSATVIEYRTAGRFSTMASERVGITAYNLDTSKPSYRCDSCDPKSSDPDSKNWWSYVINPRLSDPYNNFNWKGGAEFVAGKVSISVVNNGLIAISK